jgi:aspartate/methionine/tyrosine aminotransferase
MGDIQKELELVNNRLKEWQGKSLSLNMARGNPCHEQHRLARPMFDVITSTTGMLCEDGTDAMNYGSPMGIPEARRMMASILDTDPENVCVLGNSSLNIMYEQISRAMIYGVMGGVPFTRQMYDNPEQPLKWLCPVPGYDRHFKITEKFGFQMINIPMDENGPDMDMVEEYVNNDPTVKGIWCVPKFSNPTGCVYSEEVCKRFANLHPASPDFRIYWDNAYCVHYLTDEHPQIPEILSLCEAAGNPDLVYEFASTSKVTVAGSGIAVLAASKANLEDFKKVLTVMTIAYNKVNQVSHARFLPDKAAIEEHMKKHQAIIAPKFDEVLSVLEKEDNIGEWTRPKGGYFIAYKTPKGCAKRALEIAKECGVTMTSAGAQFPYGKDPDDTWVRIAPTFPSVEELHSATEIFVLAVKKAYLEQQLNK